MTMAHQIFNQDELVEKGLNKKAISKMLKSSETRVNFYVKQYLKLGFVSPTIKKAWDKECAKWDHLKATLAQFS